MLWWTLCVAVLFAAVVVAVSFYVVIILVAREELDEAPLGITITALALSLAICYVMLLPLEVALAEETSPTVRIVVEWVWPVAVMLCLLFVCTLVPFGMIWYESLDSDAGEESSLPSEARPGRKAAWVTAVVDFVLVAIFFLLWLAIGVVDAADEKGNKREERVPLSYFLVALTTATGWAVFFVFCGVGFAAVPIEGMRAFVNRPRAVSTAEYEASRARVHSATARLLESGRALDAEIGAGSPSRSQRRRLAAFQQQAQELETMFTDMEAAYRVGNTSVLRQYAKLCGSVLAALLSAAWVLHIILNNLAHAHAFLDAALVALDGLVPLLGCGLYAVMAFHLVWCTVCGCFTVGGNLLVFPVFSMRRGATMVNALLFNALLTILAAMAALHLCATSFHTYTRDTNIAIVFAKYTGGIVGVSHMVHCLPYALVMVSSVSVLWLLLCPKRRRALGGEESDEDFSLF